MNTRISTNKIRKKEKSLNLMIMIVIISLIMQIIMPLLIPTKSYATGDGVVSTSLGSVKMTSDATILNAGDQATITVHLDGSNIVHFSGYLEYDRSKFNTLTQSDITILNSNFSWTVFQANPDWADEINVESNVPTSDFDILQIKLTAKTNITSADIVFMFIDITNNNFQSTADEGTLEQGIACSLTIPKNTTPSLYTIEYDKNATDTVSNMPSNETKELGTIYTIPNTVPTRTNHTFKEWNTQANGEGIAYNPGDTYSIDANLKLYAIWVKEQSKLTINPNGGTWSGSTSSQSFIQNCGTTKIIENPSVTPNGNRILYSVNGGICSKLEEIQKTTFSGWTGGTLNESTYTFGYNDVTLKANYVGNSVILPEAEKDGEEFLGWYDGIIRIGGAGDSYNPRYTIANNPINLIARYGDLGKEKLYLIPKEYRIINYSGNKCLSGISIGTTLSDLKKGLRTNGEIKVINDKKYEILEDDIVGTGMILVVTKDDEEVRIPLVVTGDLDGNGKVTATDLSAINQAVLKIKQLENEYFMAADTDENNKLTATDLSTINQMVLKLI